MRRVNGESRIPLPRRVPGLQDTANQNFPIAQDGPIDSHISEPVCKVKKFGFESRLTRREGGLCAAANNEFCQKIRLVQHKAGNEGGGVIEPRRVPDGTQFQGILTNTRPPNVEKFFCKQDLPDWSKTVRVPSCDPRGMDANVNTIMNTCKTKSALKTVNQEKVIPRDTFLVPGPLAPKRPAQLAWKPLSTSTPKSAAVSVPMTKEATVNASHVGMRVMVSGCKEGTLRFVGRIQHDSGVWCGIELDEPIGLNDGVVRGVRYFTCPPQHGILAPVSKVQLVDTPKKVPRQLSDETDPCCSEPPTPSQDSRSRQGSLDLGVCSPTFDGVLCREVSFIDQISFPEYDSLMDSVDDVALLHASGGGGDVGHWLSPSAPKSAASEDLTPGSVARVDVSEGTLSPEELPMDTPLQEDASDITIPTSSSSPGPPSQSSLVAVAPPPQSNSFMTSVTSITSLDTGYQGDGESSRPASRGAELSSPPRPKPLPPPLQPPPDPMTDSDFFTESDADVHEEAGAVPEPGSGPGGDRRAQVIDGTLYNGADYSNQRHQRCPSFAVSEEMESSGVYSDLERKEEPQQQDAVDFSPDCSTKSASTRSEPSQIKDAEMTTIVAAEGSSVTDSCSAEPMDAEDTVTDDNTANNTLEITVIELDNTPPEKTVTNDTTQVNNTLQPTKNKDDTPGSVQIKKYKMPKRNVVSKVKAMLESPTPDVENQENRRPRKGGRWDAVMNKIAQGQAEHRVLKTSLKEVKSKVFAGISTQKSLPCPPLNKTKVSATSSQRASPDTKGKSRRARTLASSTTMQQPGLSNHSSAHSSASDVSMGIPMPACKTVSSLRSSKKREAGRASSPLSDGSTNSNTSNVMARGLQRSAQKNGVAEMKTQPPRKQPSRRPQTAVQTKPSPLRDHNRLASTGAPLKEPLPTKQVVPPDQLFLPILRHGTMGFEALGVLIQYLVYDLDAFATPDLKKQVEKMKIEYNNTKRSLEELQLKNRRLEETLSQEKSAYQQKVLLVETKHSQEIAELVSRHEEQLADYEKKLQLQVDEMKGRYEGELSRLDRLNAERIEALLEDGQARLEQANVEHRKEVERLQVEALRREAELQRRLTGADAELAGLKEQARRFVDGLQQDRDTKLQATAGHCRELQDEVESLRTVLDLRREEIAELRRQNLELARDAGELPQVLQKNAALIARVEDLQVQLQRKSNFERQLSQENKILMESYHQETAQKKRLSLHNEELQWKLKKNAEVVNAFAAIAGSPLNIPILTVTNGNRKSSDAEYFDSSFDNLYSRSLTPQKENHTSVSGNSPPASPKVKAVVEKGDSVSWVLEMDDAPEEILSRLVRRAGSFRGTTPPPPVSSPAHSRTLPRRPRSKTSSLTLSASASAIGHGHGRAMRPRSVSTESVEVDYHSWSEVPNCSTPVKQLEQSHLPLNDELMIHVSNKVSLKRSGDAEENVRIHQSTNGLAAKRPNAEATLEELQEKSSSMSNSSVSSSCSDGSVNSSGCGSEREYHHHLNGSKNLSDDVLDLDEAEILPLPPLPGSTSDLSLLAACAAAQPSLVPKDSGGEAMISEETSEDENEHEVVNSSDEHSCSDEEDSSSECSSGLGCESSRGLTHEDGPKSNFDEVLEGSDQRVLSDHTSKQQYNLLIMSDSTTTTTTMDISWSEDIELMPSETEG